MNNLREGMLSFYEPYLSERQKISFDAQPQPEFARLSRQLANTIFLVNPETKKPITIETGFSEISPHQVHKQLEREVVEIVRLKTEGVDAESEEGKRMRLLAPPLLAAFTTDTYIKSIQEQSYLGFVSLSLDLARYPQFMHELSIVAGYGGSVDPQSNLRLPAYAVPALHMVENIKKVCEKANIEARLPAIRFIFAPHTAIAINGSRMPEEQVLGNADKNINYLEQYIERFHPDVASQVRVDIDNSWSQHNDITRVIRKHLSSMLIATEDVAVKEALSKLQQLGMHHGDKDGQRLACTYIAAHSLIFGDALEYPNGNFFENTQRPLMAISIGGRPERLFNIARRFIRRQSDLQGLIDISPDGVRQELECYKASLMESRANYGTIFDPSLIHEADKPVASISAITSIGSAPVYYATEFDLPVKMMQFKPTTLLNEMESIIEREKTGQSKALAKERLKIVRHDINVLIKDAGGEDKLMGFIADF